VALASGLGPAAIAVIQLAGPTAAALLRRFVDLGGKSIVPDRPVLGWFRQGDQRIDQVMVYLYPCGPSGGQLIDITCHGSIRVVQRIITALEQAGAVAGDSKEFLTDSYRLPHRIAQQAYELLLDAPTELGARFLLYQAGGGLAGLVEQAMGKLVTPAGQNELADLRGRLRQAADAWPAVRYLYQPAKVVVTGPPNAGKSTLVNALAGRSAALVSELAGTTRDWVQCRIAVDGVPLDLIDTAGLGATADVLGEQAQARTRRQLQKADLVVLVMDASAEAPDRDPESFATRLPDKPLIVVLNKIDLLGEKDRPTDPPTTAVSALTGRGIDEVGEQILDRLGLSAFEAYQPAAFTERQAQILLRSCQAIEAGQFATAAAILRPML